MYFNVIPFSLQASAFKKFLPMFDRVLVERFAPELKTKSGLMIPEKAQGKVVEATVVAVGGGRQMVSHIFYYLHTQQSITCRDLFRK
mgnify:CR=1 FL=1